VKSADDNESGVGKCMAELDGVFERNEVVVGRDDQRD